MRSLLSLKKTAVFSILFVFAFTLVVPDSFGQTRRRRHRGLKTNLAIVGGSTAAGGADRSRKERGDDRGRSGFAVRFEPKGNQA